MVKCSHIIDEVIKSTMDDFGQSIRVKNLYEKLFENLINDNYTDSDIYRLIESIELDDD